MELPEHIILQISVCIRVISRVGEVVDLEIKFKRKDHTLMIEYLSEKGLLQMQYYCIFCLISLRKKARKFCV